MGTGKPPRIRHRLETLIRSRGMRLGLAFLLISVGSWSLLPYAVYNVSPSAFVNADIVRIAAPISGVLTEDLPRKGEIVSSASTTRLITSVTNDRSSLVDAEHQYEMAKAKASLSATQIAELEAADSALAKRTRDYQAAVRNRFERVLRETALELIACRREQDVRRIAMMEAEKMARNQLLAAVRLNTIKGDFYRAEQACHALSAREQELKSERDATLSGTYIQDGVGTPFSEQERSRLLLRRQELQRNLLDASSLMNQLSAKTPAIRSHFESLEHYAVKLPDGFMVWSVLANPGTAVVEGQAILELADCRHPFLVAEFPERSLASIRMGSGADFRLVGDNHWQKGVVRRIRGSAARRDDSLFAASMPNPKEHAIAVEIAMPENARQSEAGLSCDIGRLAEVRLHTSRFDPLRWLQMPPATPETAEPRTPVIASEQR
jgi:multidrug resistance efflux pump